MCCPQVAFGVGESRSQHTGQKIIEGLHIFIYFSFVSGSIYIGWIYFIITGIVCVYQANLGK